MSDKPEPLAAIIAEFRKFALRAADEDKMISPESVLLLADKVETAVERERNAHTNDIHDALYNATGIHGNAAAMREALEWTAQFIELGVDDDLGADGQNLTTAAEMARAALAAPARNCDRFTNYADARSEYDGKLGAPEWRFGSWLFEKREGGDHA